MADQDEPESAELAPTYSPSTPPPGRAPPGSGGSGGRLDKNVPVLHVGRVLADRWQVGDRIGMGGMASVHEGQDLRLGRKIAIKILHPHVAESPESRARLAREARAIAQLKHENVIEVYDYSIDDPECVWLVSELIEGSSLRTIVDRHPRTMPEVAVMVLSEVVRALRAAHAVGVIHRDVKPDNVLVGKDGRPKLSDFGIAQIVDEQRMTVTGNLVGSPSYMSPEQAEGRRTDHRTDLFSAGILLYRMVTGVLPFQGGNAIETLRKAAAVAYTDPVEVEPTCPGNVAAVIRRAMAASIEERYQSADELLVDLNAIVQQSGFGPASEELPRFFADPSGYEAKMSAEVARSLFARGKVLLAQRDEARALDLFTRARALGVSDDTSLDLVRVLSERREKDASGRNWTRAGAAALLLAVVGGVGYASGIFPGLAPSPEAAPPSPSPSIAASATPSPTLVQVAERPPQTSEPSASPSPLPVSALPSPVATEPPGIRASRTIPSASPSPSSTPSSANRRSPSPTPALSASPSPTAHAEPSASPSASPAPSPRADNEPAWGELQVGTKKWVDVYVNGVKLGRAPDQSRYRLPVGTHRLRAENPLCDPVEQEFTIQKGETTKLRLTIVCP
ncbi:MAG: protein kinase [Myxococcota bacterium]